MVWVHWAHPCGGRGAGEGRVHTGHVELDRTVVTLNQISMMGTPRGRERGREGGRGREREGGREGGREGEGEREGGRG